jgi:hypothetical protein
MYYSIFVVYFNVFIIYFNAFIVCFNVFQCISMCLRVFEGVFKVQCTLWRNAVNVVSAVF